MTSSALWLCISNLLHSAGNDHVLSGRTTTWHHICEDWQIRKGDDHPLINSCKLGSISMYHPPSDNPSTRVGHVDCANRKVTRHSLPLPHQGTPHWLKVMAAILLLWKGKSWATCKLRSLLSGHWPVCQSFPVPIYQIFLKQCICNWQPIYQLFKEENGL